MADFRIQREVMIEAPVELVWRTITEPDLITHWFATRAELELQPGGAGYFYFDEEHSGPLVVETVEPPIRFSFRWNHPDGETPAPDNSLLVEFTLTSEGSERTLLRVAESGLDLLTWPDAEKVRYADEHNGGWADFLDRLARLPAERQMG
jgi:uncharacterized protein YndB with AHSA1/START domain